MKHKKLLIIILIIIILPIIAWFSFMKILEIGSVNGAEFLEKCPLPEQLEKNYETTESREDFLKMIDWCCENYDSSHWVCSATDYLYGE